jgi:lycopene beta-cyclase
MANHQSYDFIIAGSGLSGLSLLMRIIRTGKFKDKKILLVDREPKISNDRTWCFWEIEPDLFEPIVHQQWKNVWFHGDGYDKLLNLSPYTYKLIRGIDFYEHCFSVIRQQPNVETRYGQVTEISNEKQHAFIVIDQEKITARFVFSSIIPEQKPIPKKEVQLLQHFKGWVIETNEPVFNPNEATLMDFRVDQSAGTSFVYVMPFTPTRALVEYTMFTRSVLTGNEYDQHLEKFIRERWNNISYSISDQELGVIPMTSRKFPSRDGNIIFLGTAGGQTKASSGYTFKFVQKHTADIVNRLMVGQHPAPLPQPARFRFYDRTLLNILYHKRYAGSKIFTALFKKNSAPEILKFLDNETRLLNELKIISTLPPLPFLKAASF